MKKFLKIPVNNNAKSKKILFYEDDKLVLDLDCKIDYVNPAYYAYYDLKNFNTQKLDIKISPEIGWKPEFSDEKEEYKDFYRSGVHFSPGFGWINDPNGLVYYNGSYHMFYQYNPVGTEWGNMHWGHAVSRDLFHWEEKDIALYPDEMGLMFSGSALVDEDNILGMQKNENKTMLLFYTAAGGSTKLSAGEPFTQCIAYSTDGGSSFKKYAGNPVVPNICRDNRDPKVIRYKDKFIMSLYLEKDVYAILESTDLTDWKLLQKVSLKGDSECPDFYEKDGVWRLFGASDYYLEGDFDGKVFSPSADVKRLGYGKGYAAQTFANTGDRKIRISWNTFWGASEYNTCTMSLPCELSQKDNNLTALPVREIERLYKKSPRCCQKSGKYFKEELSLGAYDIEILIKAEPFKLSIFGISMDIDPKEGIAYFKDDVKVPVFPQDGWIEMRIVADINGLEVFFGGGKSFVICGETADYTMPYIEISSKDDFELEYMKINELENIYN